MSKAIFETIQSLSTGKQLEVDKLLGADTLIKSATGEQRLRESLDKRVIRLDSIAEMTALKTDWLNDGQQVSVKGYYSGSDVGGGVFYWNSSMSVTRHDGGRYVGSHGDFGCFVRIYDRLTTDDFGVVAGDDIGPLLSSDLNQIHVTADCVVSESVSDNMIEFTTDDVVLRPKGTFPYRGTVITFNAKNAYIDIKNFDMEGRFLNAVAIYGENTHVKFFSGKNITQPDDTGEYASFLDVQGHNCIIDQVYAENFPKGPAEPNAGVRAVSLGSTASNSYVGVITAKDGNTPVVIDGSGCVIRRIKAENCNGNGFYAIAESGTTTIESLELKDHTDEMAVITSKGTVIVGKIYANGAARFGVESAGRVYIGEMDLVNTNKNALGSLGEIIRSRNSSSTTPTESLFIGRLTAKTVAIENRLVLWSVDQNPIKNFHIGQLDLEIDYQNSSEMLLGFWSPNASVETFYIDNLNIIADDNSGKSHNNNQYMSIQLPNVTEGGHVRIGTFRRRSGTANIRLDRSAQSTLTIIGSPKIRTNFGGFVEGDHIIGTRRPMDFYGDGALPQEGYFIRGDRLWDAFANPSESPGRICVASGSPGTWAAMPNLGSS